MQTLPQTPEKPPVHWTYGAMLLIVFCLPFLLVFGFGLSDWCGLIWCLFLFF